VAICSSVRSRTAASRAARVGLVVGVAGIGRPLGSDVMAVA
jgi:hypothetical protein